MSELKTTAVNPADANAITREYLDSIQIEMRILDSVKADTTFELFGKTFTSPIMTPAFSHLRKTNEAGETQMEEYAQGAKEAGIVNFAGMESNELFEKILQACPETVRIVKPYQDPALVLDELTFAEKNGALAVGMDIDHPFGNDAEYDVVDDIPMGPIYAEHLKKYVQAVSLPFIAKGVLSVTDALKCRDAGCAGIVVSHHHGRVPFGIPPLKVLPAIKEAVGDDMKIFVDCGISSGYDAYKALALGADAVSVGSALLKPLNTEGKDGVVKKISDMNRELKLMMEYTNTPSLKEMDSSVLYFD